ncbi:MAG: hypothetical protein A2622_01160 [Bdellovibrionales bacterium RIFCSPHIGHO2_01_FULL_40_29]|nr:MAG: hypothetical protein A2622_01160 [Bdellovibrionales bacterium RIFCSPHIGHO2_01_FULL_40_29]OFZ32722.1 MAG: hypothetical protein A3D17_05760 [Bdellovibrionales bacterium RIFCSPHIGHO2_02_FULL_40_15]
MLHTLLYFLALFSLSTSPNWARLSQMPVDVLGFWRLLIASVLIFVWVFFYRRQPFPRIEKKFFWVIASGIFFFGHLWTYKYASKTTSVANTMIFFATNPIWSTLGSIFFFNERFTRRLGLAYLLALSGITLLVSHQFDLNSTGFLGDISAIASALLFSAYILTGKRARIYYSNSVYASFQYLIGAICFFLAVLISGHDFTNHSTISWTAVAGLVIFPTLLGHLSFSYLMSTMNLSLMSCGKLIEPVLASIIAYFVFGELLTPHAIMAFILTASALFVLFMPSLRFSKT